MDTLQAAILLEILEIFPNEVVKRKESWPKVIRKAYLKVKGIETPTLRVE